jgi:radical SAM family uncharacterized protein/radical SAM-linked protein
VNLSSFKKPSRYINREFNAVHKEAPLKVALAFPDVYEIGMSHLGLKILYKIINDLPFASAERVFSPWIDLEAEMKSRGMRLSSLESNRPLMDFDVVGFSLQYELSYTTVLNMLHLGGIPVRAEERKNFPLVIAGGPCTVNPFPMSPFIDAFLIGDGEEAIGEILGVFYEWKNSGDGKKESLLIALSAIEGVYVPSVHGSDSSVRSGNKLPAAIRRRIVRNLDDAPFPDHPVVPYTSIVHDRVNIEVSRGCSMGCRFCQAGMIYRPVRERSSEKVLELIEKSLKNTGYEEAAFTSLSAGDYSCLLQVVREFNRKFAKSRVALSLPSLRVASINRDLLREIRSVRKTGFTIAPEAGTERLRKVINKDFTLADYEHALNTLFEEGWLNLKLYFMIGLPTETDEDIEGIIDMAFQAIRTAKRFMKRFVNITVGISPFVPKSHTPFQWYGQCSSDELERKKRHIRNVLRKKGINVKGHDIEMSLLEAAFCRGDERLSLLIEKAWSLGCRLDGWSDLYDFGKWKTAMDLTGIDAVSFATRTFAFSDILPWEKIDIGVKKEFLWDEYQRALSGDITADCRKICHQCGVGCHERITKKGEEETKEEFAGSEIRTRPCSPESVAPVVSVNTIPRFGPVRIRSEFSKTGRMKYLSHLELVIMLQRAMRRAGFPLEYSRGFHPFPKISFGPPLGVGISGMSEYFDMEVTPPFDLEMNRGKLNNTLPEGVFVKDMAGLPTGAESLNSFITRYEYEVRGTDLSHATAFLSAKEMWVEREKGSVNVRDMVEDCRIADEDSIRLMLVDRGDARVRLGEILPVTLGVPMERLDITRVALYGWNGGWVKPLERSLQWIAK